MLGGSPLYVAVAPQPAQMSELAAAAGCRRARFAGPRAVVGVTQSFCTVSFDMLQPSNDRRYEIVDFASLPGVDCPCGTARRAFAEADGFPASVHQTEISADARIHYHRRLTEVYYVLDCGPEAQLELDGELISLTKGRCVMIRPGVRHRAIGRMTVLVIVAPKFDPADEWFD